MADQYPKEVLDQANQYGVDPSVIATMLARFPGAKITSGRRDPIKNAAVGGVANSQHLAGPTGTASALDFVMGPPDIMQQAATDFKDPNYRAIYEPKMPRRSTGDHIHLQRIQQSVEAAKPREPVDPNAKAPPIAPAPTAESDPSEAVFGADTEKMVKTLKELGETNPDLKQIREQAKASIDAASVTAEQIKSDLPMYDKLMEIYNRPAPIAGKQQEIPKENVVPIGNPVEALGKFLPLLALLGGAMNKKYAMGALNSATAAMNAQKAGDFEKRDQEHLNYLTDQKRLIENNAIVLQEYENALKKYTTDQATAVAEMTMIANKHQDLNMLSTLASGNVKTLGSVIEANKNALAPVVELYKASIQAKAGKNIKLMSGPDGSIIRVNVATGEAFDAAGNPLAEIPKGSTNITGGGRSPASQVFTKYRQDHPLATAEELQAENQRLIAGQRVSANLASGKDHTTVMAFSTAVAHLDLIRDLAKALNNPTDIRTINELWNRVGTELNWHGTRDFDAARQLVANEIVKAVSGSAGALADRQEAKDQLSRASTAEALGSAIDVYQQLMASQLESIKIMYTANGGEAAIPFNNFLQPRARQVLQQAEASSLQPTADGSQPGAPPKPAGTYDTSVLPNYQPMPKGNFDHLRSIPYKEGSKTPSAAYVNRTVNGHIKPVPIAYINGQWIYVATGRPVMPGDQ